MREISLLDTILGFTLPTDVALADDYAYIAAQSQGLAVVDLHGDPRVVYRYTMGSETDPVDARAVAVTPDDVILASGDSLHLFSRADPAHPAFVGSVAVSQITALAVSGERVLAGGDNRLIALDLTTSDFVSTTDTLTDTRGLAVAGDYVYAVGAGGLRVLHWPQHVAPTPTDSIEGMTFHAVAVGSVLTVGTDSGVSVLSLADPAHPAVIGAYPTPHRVIAVEIMGDTLYALDAAGRVEWLSLADPTHPTRLAVDQALDQPSALGVGGGLLASTDLTGGLFLWRPTRSTLYFPFILH